MHGQCIALLNALQTSHGALHPAVQASSQPALQPYQQQHQQGQFQHRDSPQGQPRHQAQQQGQGQGQSCYQDKGQGQTHSQGQGQRQCQPGAQQCQLLPAADIRSAQHSAKLPAISTTRLPSHQPPSSAAWDTSQGVSTTSARPDLLQPGSDSLASLVPTRVATGNASTDSPAQGMVPLASCQQHVPGKPLHCRLICFRTSSFPAIVTLSKGASLHLQVSRFLHFCTQDMPEAALSIKPG